MLYGVTVMTLSDRLLRELEQRGWSQQYAAVQWDIPVQTLNDLIRKKKEPTLSTLRKLAKGLNESLMTLVELAGFDVQSVPETPEPPAFLRGLTAEDRAIVEAMTPEEFQRLLDAWRKLQGR
jgi:transcriptional regulator with XRE-family HTH domain